MKSALVKSWVLKLKKWQLKIWAARLNVCFQPPYLFCVYPRVDVSVGVWFSRTLCSMGKCAPSSRLEFERNWPLRKIKTCATVKKLVIKSSPLVVYCLCYKYTKLYSPFQLFRTYRHHFYFIELYWDVFRLEIQAFHATIKLFRLRKITLFDQKSSISWSILACITWVSKLKNIPK